jgi:hypothetical protein
MSVKAKFKVQRFESSLQNSQIDLNKGWEKENLHEVEMRTVILSPVYGNGDPNHENTKFWHASPMGEVKLGTINPEAWQYFELGKDYYLEFTAAD